VQEKIAIARGVIHPFLNKLVADFEGGIQKDAPSRASMNFSSESHLHCPRNFLFLTCCA
jgi:hypothetical protein